MIGTSLYTLLSGHAPLTAIIGTKLFPVEAPQGKENPMVIYGITGTQPQETKSSVSTEDWVTVEIVSYSNDYDQSQQIAKEVRNALDKKSGVIAGNTISDIVFQDFEDGWDTSRECYAPIMKFLLMSTP